MLLRVLMPVLALASLSAAGCRPHAASEPPGEHVTVVLDVGNMTCEGCVKTITGVLTNAPDVTDVAVSLDDKTASFTAPAHSVPGRIRSLEAKGYELSIRAETSGPQTE